MSITNDARGDLMGDCQENFIDERDEIHEKLFQFSLSAWPAFSVKEIFNCVSENGENRTRARHLKVVLS